MPKKQSEASKHRKLPTSLRQVAALPFRVKPCGSIEILIITSRETGRFLIPKRWPKKSTPDSEAAAEEAFEEAGLIGKARRKPIGTYSYWKRLAEHFVFVSVDPLHVTEQRRDWREKGQRRMAWLSTDDVATLIDEPKLIGLIRAFKKDLKAAN